jgi:hypothetical protein
MSWHRCELRGYVPYASRPLPASPRVTEVGWSAPFKPSGTRHYYQLSLKRESHFVFEPMVCPQAWRAPSPFGSLWERGRVQGLRETACVRYLPELHERYGHDPGTSPDDEGQILAGKLIPWRRSDRAPPHVVPMAGQSRCGCACPRTRRHTPRSSRYASEPPNFCCAMNTIRSNRSR